MKTGSLILGICQLAVTPDKALNIHKAEAMLKAAANSNCQLAVLPEMFNCPYEAQRFNQYAEIYPGGATLQMLSKTAARERIAIVGGSIPERDESLVTFTIPVSFLMNREIWQDGTGKYIYLMSILQVEPYLRNQAF